MRTFERASAIKFLKDHVIGKVVLSAPVTTFTDLGRIKGVYRDQTFFSNLTETADSFRLDLTVLAKGTRYQKDSTGEMADPEGSLNAIRVYRYEMTERKSSGRLVGFARYVSSTNTAPDPFVGTVFLVEMWLEDGTLVVQETQVGYADFVAVDGTFTPVASDGKYRYAVEGDKLVVQYEQATFGVDPETLRRTPTTDKFPTQVSKEVNFYIEAAETEPDWA
jgi:hypothetical protein